jgi:NhaA family Na+:H+ antiporter
MWPFANSRALFAIRDFLRLEAAGGVMLAAAALVAIVAANSPLAGEYRALVDLPVSVRVGSLGLAKPLLHWINDGLMAVFFLLVGLEIKREVLLGELSTIRKAALPAVAALGGMAVPALVYVAVNSGPTLQGWAIPSATDIAFAVAVLTLAGRRVPQSLKIFLLALAVIDDLGAILIIALFYTAHLSLASLGLAAAALVVLIVLNRSGVRRIGPYVLVGMVLWVCVLESGVHATLAGVVLALAIPAAGGSGPSPLERLEHALHPWVTYAILPVFAFANAGVSLAGVTPDSLLQPVPLGIALGLFVGKQVGIVLATTIAVALGWGIFPAGATRLQFYGMAVVTGIGFTMSLFIGTLAFPDGYDAPIRLGVLGGSLLSGMVGAGLLVFGGRRANPSGV